MSVHYRTKGGWFCTWRENGRQPKKFFGHDELARARAQAFDEQKRLGKGKGSRVEAVSVSEILNKYHHQHAVEPSTGKTDGYAINRWLIPRFGGIPADLLTKEHLDQYLIDRMIGSQGHAPVKKRTVAREISILKAALNWAVDQVPPILKFNPVASWHIKRAHEGVTPSPPTAEEMGKILAVSPPHLYRALLISWYTGIRPGGESARLKWSDVNFEDAELRVTSAHKGGPSLRYIPLAALLLEEMKKWKAGDALSIAENKGKTRWPDGIDIDSVPIVYFHKKAVPCFKTAWKGALSRAGIQRGLRPYDLRHAAATNALRHGADLKSVSKILGHSREDTTLRFYQHVVRDQAREAIAKIPAPKKEATGGNRATRKKKAANRGG